MNSLVLYLLQVAICHTVFYLLYRTLYSNLAYFNFSRIYLLSATVISFIIPLLSIGVWQPSDHVTWFEPVFPCLDQSRKCHSGEIRNH